MSKKSTPYNPQQKVAILMLALGEEIAAEIFRHMPRREVLAIAQQMQSLGRISSELCEKAIEDFSFLLERPAKLLSGGPEATAALLSKALHSDDAGRLFAAWTAAGLKMPAVDRIDGPTLASLIRDEHPQTITLILAFCPPAKLAATMKALPAALHPELLVRLVRLETVSPSLIEEIDTSLAGKIRQLGARGTAVKGGAEALASMLAGLAKDAAESLLASLAERDPELAAAVLAKMFTFDDLAKLPDATMRSILKHIPPTQWRLPLKLAQEPLRAKIFGNMSERAAKLLQEDLAALPPSRKEDVEKAQRLLVEEVRKLEAGGLISLSDDLV